MKQEKRKGKKQKAQVIANLRKLNREKKKLERFKKKFRICLKESVEKAEKVNERIKETAERIEGLKMEKEQLLENIK